MKMTREKVVATTINGTESVATSLQASITSRHGRAQSRPVESRPAQRNQVILLDVESESLPREALGGHESEELDGERLVQRVHEAHLPKEGRDQGW
jgi:hypothetical protein